MFDWVQVDEKWFYLMKDRVKCLFRPWDTSNSRHCVDIRTPTPLSRPRKLSNSVWFDGKIGIWPIVDVVMVQCASESRARGDPVLKPVAVDGEKYKKIVIDEVIPPIKPTMPRPQATPSSSSRTRPNSADLNVKDLGFFHYIRQLKENVRVTTAEGLVEVTLEAFDIYPRETLEYVLHSLFAVYGEILGSKGDNS
ncbi:unnamed protein product [Discosporangium mesarthrocarpum]